MSIENLDTSLTIASASDLHIREAGIPPKYYSLDQYRDLVSHMSDHADVITISGDILSETQDTERTIRTSTQTAQLLGEATVPVIAVLGNHDVERNHGDLVRKILQDEGGVHMLEGTSYTIGDVGFVGSIGTGGGFEENLHPLYADNARAANARLAQAITEVSTPKKVVLLHYSPIEATLEGEKLTEYPGLGNAGLETVVDKDPNIVAVFHGHAHLGSPEGKTQSGIPVYNVALQVMQRINGVDRNFEPAKLYRTLHV